ncbi:MAG TPA: LapA family protein [bacterium]|nr:LapA family protein [bacterium]
MSAFTIFAVLLLVVTAVFALSNPAPVAVRFVAWQYQTSLALAVIAGVVLGGFLVFVSSLAGQTHLRARVRDLQARLREAEAKLPAPAARPETPGRWEERP